MNRPPTMNDYLPPQVIDVIETWEPNETWDNMAYMQEALTAEWLIEQGLMPDPTELHQQIGYGMFRPSKIYGWRNPWQQWVCYDVEDMDKAFPKGWRHFRDTYGEDKTK